MPAKIDLSKAHLVRRHGDITAVYTWVNDERAIVLIPIHRKLASWYIVCESAAYRYDEPEYLARQAAVAADVLGMEPSPNNWVRIASIIHDGLPDLIRMPPAPEPELTKATYGELKVMQDGKLVGGEEIRLEKDEGAVYG